VKKEENINEELLEEAETSIVEESDDATEALKRQLKDEREKSEEYYEHLKRNMAEFDNFKKRISKEKDMMYDMIVSNIITDLLPMIDNFEKALDTATSDEAYKDGMTMIHSQLIETLEKLGVEEIKCLNKNFDPNLHEAVMHLEDENFGEKEVIEIFRKGYIKGDKVIRHAMVKVAN